MRHFFPAPKCVLLSILCSDTIEWKRWIQITDSSSFWLFSQNFFCLYISISTEFWHGIERHTVLFALNGLHQINTIRESNRYECKNGKAIRKWVRSVFFSPIFCCSGNFFFRWLNSKHWTQEEKCWRLHISFSSRWNEMLDMASFFECLHFFSSQIVIVGEREREEEEDSHTHNIFSHFVISEYWPTI